MHLFHRWSSKEAHFYFGFDRSVIRMEICKTCLMKRARREVTVFTVMPRNVHYNWIVLDSEHFSSLEGAFASSYEEVFLEFNKIQPFLTDAGKVKLYHSLEDANNQRETVKAEIHRFEDRHMEAPHNE